MSIQIRQAEEKDVRAILDILNYEILNSTSVYDYTPRTFEAQLEWFQRKKKDSLPVIVAERKLKVVGYATFGIFRPWEAFKLSIEHSLYIDKNSRSEGIGKLLMDEIIHLAIKEGFHSMIAGIDASNEGSYEFHQKFGFEEVGRLNQVGFKFNKWLDLIFMQRYLDQ